jgi:glycosyltransferase involved in cell wall biosynthesis
MFSRRAWWRRDIGLRLQASGNRTIMLSSSDAERDCRTFYPKSGGKIAVVRFAIDLDPAEHLGRAAQIRTRHGLPDRYFYLPNQFWTHKNHAVVVAALERIAGSHGLAAVPPIVMTGRTEDPRDPGLYARVMAEADRGGVAGHFRHLGLVPYEDVFGLNAAADALINPSLFEGWSTTVEEAKALGTRMLLSDISLHREQAPDASFFDPHGPDALAAVLLDVAKGPAWQRAPAATLSAAHADRRRAYADALEAVFRRATAV